jgi:hypothetical protein
MLRKKMAVFEGAVRFFKGTESQKASARKRLASLGLATAAFLMELPEYLVPKSGRPKPDPDDFESFETPEDKALEVVKDIQDGVIRKGSVDSMMQFFAVFTGKPIELDAVLAGTTRELRPRRVHPIPAMWSIGRDLGCDMDVVDPDAEVVRLPLPALIDIRIHGEDVRWLLESMATQGGFKAVLDPAVKGPVDFRVRADSFEAAFRSIAKKGGYEVTQVEGGLQVKKGE